MLWLFKSCVQELEDTWDIILDGFRDSACNSVTTVHEAVGLNRREDLRCESCAQTLSVRLLLL